MVVGGFIWWLFMVVVQADDGVVGGLIWWLFIRSLIVDGGRRWWLFMVIVSGVL